MATLELQIPGWGGRMADKSPHFAGQEKGKTLQEKRASSGRSDRKGAADEARTAPKGFEAGVDPDKGTGSSHPSPRRTTMPGPNHTPAH